MACPASVLAAAQPLVFAWAGAALGGVLLLLSLRANRRRRLIDDIPTSKTTGVFIGLVELKGAAEAERPLRSFLAEVPCVQYAWCVEERWERTVTETRTDSEGRTRTRTRTDSGWTTVGEGAEQVLFYLADDCGVIRVDPEHAEIHGERMFSETVGRGEPLYFSKGPAREIANSDHRRRFTETAVPLHAPLYVMGRARLRDDVVAPEIACDRDAPVFLISTKSEEQLSAGYKWQARVFGVLAVLAVVGGWVVKDHLRGRDPATVVGNYLGIAAVAAGAWLLAWVWMVYNGMMGLRQRVGQGWSNVDVQLKRRADLIPNLVEIVQGLRGYEREVQEQVALLRSQAAVTAPGEPGADPRACARQLVALQEAYPELKANQAFLDLQRQLVQTEQKIALAREYFNTIASFYNARLQVVPDRFVCAVGGLKPRPYIAAADFEKAPVTVDLAD